MQLVDKQPVQSNNKSALVPSIPRVRKYYIQQNLYN